jgi:hypothetical protein
MERPSYLAKSTSYEAPQHVVFSNLIDSYAIK